MLKIETTTNGLEVNLALKTLTDRLNPGGKKLLCGRLATSLKRIFRKKFNENAVSPKDGERSGWASTGFWQRAGNSIETEASHRRNPPNMLNDAP